MTTPAKEKDMINIGDYGELSFTIRKKRKDIIKGEEPFVITGFVMRGEIVDIDAKYLLFRDNDDMEYIVTKSRIRGFEKINKDH